MASAAEDSALFARWEAELEYAQKDERYRKWLDQSDKIVKRYRDQRNAAGSADVGRRKYNILWANVQTLGPAVYGKMPKPIAERRFLDRDPSARLASLVLERVLAFQMDIGGFHGATDKSVLDYLLPGMGQVWVRYEPSFESTKVDEENKAIDRDAPEDPDMADDEGMGEPEERLTFERTCFDYVFYRDFLWSPARSWTEVPWIAKRTWEDRASCEEKFGEEIARQIIYGDPKNKDLAGIASNEPMTLGKSKKAEVWEIWCKPEGKVIFIAPDTPGIVLKQEDDPLHLEGFWPCPEPLFTTQTNDTLVPVPDYVEYQDQAAELDDLTDRISQITTAVKATGVYNSEYKELARLLQEGGDNRLVPVDQWAMFAENGGLKGAIDLIPMDVIMAVLTELYAARDHVLQDIYQITGLSDIIRGATDPNETMGAQKIKANYATGRLGSRQERVAEFCAAVVRIAGELIAEIFSDESLAQMSGYDQMCADQVREAVEGVDQPSPPEGFDQMPPEQQQMVRQQGIQQFQQMQQQAAQQATAKCQAEFQGALKILRSDKLRGFRVDIETDSTIADDMQQDKAAAQEYIVGLFQSLQGAETVVAQAPELIKPLGESIMWASRKMRVGRTLESAWEDAFDKLEKRMEEMRKQPPPPDPEMIKAQAQVQVAQAKAQEANVTAQAEQQRAQSDTAIAAAKLQGEQKAAELKTQLDAATLQIDQLKAAIESDTEMQKARLQSLTQILVARIGAKTDTDSQMVDAQMEALLGLAKMQHEKDMQAIDHGHQANMQSSQQEADAAMQPADGKPAPKPKPKASDMGIFTNKDDVRHEETMGTLKGMQDQQGQLANALSQLAQGLNAIAAMQGAPKRVIFGPDGRPVGIETVN